MWSQIAKFISFLPALLRTHLNWPNPTLITQMNRDVLRQRLPYPLDAVLNLRLVRVPIVDVTLRNAVGAEEDVLLRAEFFELRWIRGAEGRSDELE